MTCAVGAPHSTLPKSSADPRTADQPDFSPHEWQTLHRKGARPSVLRTRRYDLSDRPKRALIFQIYAPLASIQQVSYLCSDSMSLVTVNLTEIGQERPRRNF